MLDSENSVETPGIQNRRSSKSNIIILVMGVVILVLFGIIGFFIIDKKEAEVEKTELLSEKEQILREVTALDKENRDLELALSNATEIEADLKTKVQEIQTKNTSLQNRINQLINQNNLSRKEKEELDAKLKTLEYYNEKNLKRIAELEGKVKELESEKSTLQDSLGRTQKEMGNILDENTLAKNKIKAGSKLVATEFNFTGIYGNNKEKEPKEGNILKFKRSLNGIKVCCTIGKNNIAEPGKRDFYIVIKGPRGILSSVETVSGYFKIDGKESMYSVKSSIVYTNNKAELCIPYQSDKFDKGRYTVTVFTKDSEKAESAYEVGKENFEFK
jgi:hypothetical protein